MCIRDSEDIAKAIPLYTWDGDINYYTGAGSPEQSAVDRTTEETIYQNYTAYLNYNKNFGLDHHLDAMLGMAYEAEEVRMFMARRDNFITDELWELNPVSYTHLDVYKRQEGDGKKERPHLG